MNRVAALACSLALAGCGSFNASHLLPSLPGGGSGGNPIKLESDPPGAEAQTSLGPACRTPCALSIPAREEFTVTFTLPGYETQTVPIGLQASGGLPGEFTTSVQLVPNPVFVQLEPAASPPPTKKKTGKAKPRTVAKPAAAPAPAEIPASQRTIPGAQPTAPPAAAWPPPR
jgi:hypothetical protein